MAPPLPCCWPGEGYTPVSGGEMGERPPSPGEEVRAGREVGGGPGSMPGPPLPFCLKGGVATERGEVAVEEEGPAVWGGREWNTY